MKNDNSSDRWRNLSHRRRCRIVAATASRIASAASELAELCESDQRTDRAETLGAELLPFCDALKFIGRSGPTLLRSQRRGLIQRPLWMWGVQSSVERNPHGKVLILGTWNYPVLLVGTQAAQALAAGNEVIIKPAVGSEAITARMVQAFHDAGVPRSVLQQIDSSTESAVAAMERGVDLIVLTGAAATGRKVMEQAAKTLTPTIMELSGCDAVVVLPEADVEWTADAIRFGLCVNSGATCIGPRRLLVMESQADRLAEALRSCLAGLDPMVVHPAARQTVADTIEAALTQGATDLFNVMDTEQIRTSGKMCPTVLDHVQPQHTIAAADLFAPVASIIRVDSLEQAVEIVNTCPYRLAASVFGPADQARKIAEQLSVGSVTINDLVMPTADPRLPFGGRGQSGFGVTRGAEGLLAMTTPRVISRRRGRFALHLQPRRPYDVEALLGLLQIRHADSLANRLRGLGRLIRAPRSASATKDSNSLHESET